MELSEKTLSKLTSGINLNEKETISNFTKRTISELKEQEKCLLGELEKHHTNTLVHSIMVAHDVEYIAKRLGLSEDKVKALTIAALLHDLGKLFIHDSVLDLGGRLDLEEIWKNTHTGQPFPKNPMQEIRIKDLINYNAEFKSKDSISTYILGYLEWMKKNEVKEFLNQSLRTYLEYHQKGTEIILNELKLNPEIVLYAASHHPTYFTEDQRSKLPKEVKIIEVADKFNALMQTEGIRYYVTKKTKIEAMLIIVETLEKKFEHHHFFFETFEEEIIKILAEKYFTREDILNDLIPRVKNAINRGEDVEILKEDEKLIALLIVILSFSKDFDEILIHDLVSLENKLLDILDKLHQRIEEQNNLQLYKKAA